MLVEEMCDMVELEMPCAPCRLGVGVEVEVNVAAKTVAAVAVDLRFPFPPWATEKRMVVAEDVEN